MSTPMTLLPFRPASMSPAQLAAVSFLVRYSGRTHHRYAAPGMSAARIFCLLNGHDLAQTVDEAEDLMLRAASAQLEVAQIAAWLATHLVPSS